MATPVPQPFRTCTDQGVRERTKAWYDIRNTGIGASEIAMALGISPYGSPYSLYLKKRGELADTPDNESMAWGRDLENVILKRFLRGHPHFRESKPITKRLLRSKERPWQLATPDAVVWDKRRPFYIDRDQGWIAGYGCPVVVQIKTADNPKEWGQEGSDEIPVHYRAQVMQEMDVVGARVAWVPVLFHGRDYREYRVEHDITDANILRIRGREFWHRVVNNDPPDPDSSVATLNALKGTRFEPGTIAQVDPTLAEKIKRAKRVRSAAEALVRKYENRLRFEMGEAETAMAGTTVLATRKTYEQRVFDIEEFRRQHPDLATSFTSKAPRQRLNITSRKVTP